MTTARRGRRSCSISLSRTTALLLSSLVFFVSSRRGNRHDYENNSIYSSAFVMSTPPANTNSERVGTLLRPRAATTPRTSITIAKATVGEIVQEGDSGSNTGDLETENVVIIGSGPAGYTAAIYCGRANLKPLLFEGINTGPPGGQLMTTTEVENFPGFPDGITGPELMANMRQQGERWGAVFETEDIESVDLAHRPFTVRSTSRVVKAHSIIIATGATARRLGLPAEEDFWSRGISACAICDGAAPIFRDVELGVVGGGDSAVEEAVYLTKYSPKVHLFVRGQSLAASRSMIDRLSEETTVRGDDGTICLMTWGVAIKVPLSFA